MKRTFALTLGILTLAAICGCKSGESFVNPGDFLGGGGTGETAESADSSAFDSATDEAVSNADAGGLKDETSEEGAALISPTDGIVTLSESGGYLFRGTYGGIVLGEDGLALHLIFDGAKIENDGIGLDGSGHKKAEVVLTLKDGTENFVTGGSDNGIQIKGSLSVNGGGALTIEGGKNGIKVSKAFKAVDASLTVTAENHGIAAASVSASDCSISVEAGKDGLQAECDDETTEFTADEGFVVLKGVQYSCNVEGDGIQADTVAYIDGGTYSIKTTGSFVADSAEARAEYGLTSDDFRYVKQGNDFKKVASDYRGGGLYALKQGCKGIKVGEIEYPDPADESGEREITVTEGNYCIAIAGGEFTIDSTDDAIHTNSGAVTVSGGTFTVSTCDDAITADGLTKIEDGNITVTHCYEGIEGGYVEIGGGTIDILSEDDGINAASDDPTVKEHILITGGLITVNAEGDGIDSNGSILISGGAVYVAGPTSGDNSALDADSGILVNGGILFATGALGMVETPATNSEQNVVSYATDSAIAAGTTLALKGTEELLSFTLPKSCRSVILSCPELLSGGAYSITADGNDLCSFTVSGRITTVGSAGGFGGPGGFGGGGRPGGPGGFGGPGGRP